MRGEWLALIALLLASASAKKNLTVGYLAVIKGNLMGRQGLAVSGALTLALDKINSDPTLLPNVHLALRWNDTQGDIVMTTRAMTEMINDGVAVFFGLEGTCFPAALVAHSRNIPMISYKCSDYKASIVPTFARTEPSETQVTKSVIALLLYYGWNKFLVFYEQGWETVANSLMDQANAKNMTSNGIQAMDSHKCCLRKLPCCQIGYWYKAIQDTKNQTRIYVFLGAPPSLIDMMNTMHSAQLFDNGEYMVIYVDKNTYSKKEPTKYLWTTADITRNESCFNLQKDFMKRARSLLVIVPTTYVPSTSYVTFTKDVLEYDQKKPFNLIIPDVLKNFTKYVSIYAANLYDSVYLYANALHDLLAEESRNKEITDDLIDEIASNGTKIILTIIKRGTYESIIGSKTHVDSNGDSEGNFSVLAFKESILSYKGFSCTHQMVRVGHFQQMKIDSLEYKPNIPIDWPGTVKPKDESSCGFDNRFCPKDDNYKWKIASSVLTIFLVCAGIITVGMYRKWKQIRYK